MTTFVDADGHITAFDDDDDDSDDDDSDSDDDDDVDAEEEDLMLNGAGAELLGASPALICDALARDGCAVDFLINICVCFMYKNGNITTMFYSNAMVLQFLS